MDAMDAIDEMDAMDGIYSMGVNDTFELLDTLGSVTTYVEYDVLV